MTIKSNKMVKTVCEWYPAVALVSAIGLITLCYYCVVPVKALVITLPLILIAQLYWEQTMFYAKKGRTHVKAVV